MVDIVAAAVVRSRPAAVVPWAHTGDFGMAAFGIVAAEVHRKRIVVVQSHFQLVALPF